MDGKWLQTSDVARRLGLTTDGVIYLERSGHLRATRTLSGTRLFDAQDVERLRREREKRKEQKVAG